MTVTARRPVRLEDRYELRDGEIYLSGLQALVRIALDQNRLDRRNGVDTATFISGYEGSPLAGFDLELSRQGKLLEKHGVVFKPSVNEELGANAVQGSQLASTVGAMTCDGVVGIWYGKAPGLDRATDALRHANLGGAAATGGVLVLVGDDSTAKSSTVPSSSEIAMSEIGMTVLSPSDPQDVLNLGMHWIALSRFCGLWTGLKLATNVVDGAGTAVVRTDQVDPVFPDRMVDGTPFQHEVSAHFLQPTLATLEKSLVHERPELARRYAYANGLNRVEGDPAARIGIVTAGAAYLDVRQALSILGISVDALPSSGIRILKLGMVSPLEPRIVTEFADGLNEIVVVEEKRPFIELAVKDLFYGAPGAPAVYGKRGPGGAPLLRADGDLPPDTIAVALAPRIAATTGSSAAPAWLERSTARSRPSLTLMPMVNRTALLLLRLPAQPVHRGPRGLPRGGRHRLSALASYMPEERVGSIVGLCQMGGEGVAWIGMAPFVHHRHLVQNLGDGTFHHSGSLAIRASVAAGSTITYKLLHNGAVAMTGGQQAVGKMSVPEIVAELLAEGVARVVVTTEDLARYKRVRLPRGVEVRHRDRLIETQEDLARIEGVTVLIHDQECATELRRKRKRRKAVDPATRVFINERVCEGCGDCGHKSNCLSVQPVDTEFGRKTQIHQASCNKDFSCLDGDCPSFISVVPGTKKPVRARTTLETAELPEPMLKVDPADCTIRITGIGGTGVVTTAQIISSAAVMARLYVRSLDQLGMAQKGGAVVCDIKMSTSPFTGANKVAAGECDLYLGCDILVAANATNLDVASPDRTIAVMSTSAVPTGAMVTDPGASFPDLDLTRDRIDQCSRTADNAYGDVRSLVTALFGDNQFANIFQVGMAVQAGALPVDPEILERAIELNGVAVELNLQAFRRGRQLIADPAALQAALPVTEPADAGPSDTARTLAEGLDLSDKSLRDVVLRRTDELIAYQDRAYAQRYVAVLKKVQEQERTANGQAGPITRAVAANLYKLMAYKDEYEVARLSLDPELERQLKTEFGDDVRYAYKLHPPVLRAAGIKHKIGLGSWFRPGFRTLYAMRRLRGTPLDPFGRGEVRSTERALIDEYVTAVDAALRVLTPTTADKVLEVAETADLVRGYEQIKLANVARFRERLFALRADLGI